MISSKHIAAVLGFAFVAIWIAVDFGAAVLCLVGAAVFWAVAAFLRGELDLAEIQNRFGRRQI
jgi:hypothetical protein